MSGHSGPRGTWKLRGGLHITTLKGVYPPSEDTFFLASVIDREPLRGKRALDMGTGTGYIAVHMAKKGARVVAADVQPRAVLNARLNARLNGVKIRTVLSDLFEHVSGVFDVIVFNPPYLEPWGEVNDVSWDERGVVKRFLEEVGDHLGPSGKFFLVMEENETFRRVLPLLDPFSVRFYRNAFHLVVVEGSLL